MSLLNHLVRATLAPEQAARPALPQQFANWGGDGGNDDVEWGEESDAGEAPLPAPRAEPIRDDPFAARARPPAPELEPGVEMPGPAKRQSPKLPEVEAAPPPRSARPVRAVEPAVEAVAAAPVPIPAQHPNSPRPQPPLDAAAPQPRSTRRGEPVELAEPEIAVTLRAQAAPLAADLVAVASGEAALPHAVTPVARPPADILSHPGRHDPSVSAPAEARLPLAARVEARSSAPADAGTPLSAPDVHKDRPRLAEPRVAAPIAREAAHAPTQQMAAPLIAPVAAPASAVTPVLAAPQVVLQEPAAAQPQLPDVHISIGRVEVRAAAAPPRPAPRETGNKAEPLSLDAYLHRRNGSR